MLYPVRAVSIEYSRRILVAGFSTYPNTALTTASCSILTYITYFNVTDKFLSEGR